MAKLLDPVVLGDDIPLRNRISNKPTEASVRGIRRGSRKTNCTRPKRVIKQNN